MSVKAEHLATFKTSPVLKTSDLLVADDAARLVVKIGSEPAPIKPIQPQIIENNHPIVPNQFKQRKNRAFLRRVSIFLLLLGLFSVALFTTQNYLRNGRIFPKIQNPFGKPEGILTSNTNLRIGPGTDNPAIQLIAKGSRVRIISSKIINNKDEWWEVDVIEYSRPKTNPADADHGWMTKNNIDVQE